MSARLVRPHGGYFRPGRARCSDGDGYVLPALVAAPSGRETRLLSGALGPAACRQRGPASSGGDPAGNHLRIALDFGGVGFKRVAERLQLVGARLQIVRATMLPVGDLMLPFRDLLLNLGELEAIRGLLHELVGRAFHQCFFRMHLIPAE